MKLYQIRKPRAQKRFVRSTQSTCQVLPKQDLLAKPGLHVTPIVKSALKAHYRPKYIVRISVVENGNLRNDSQSEHCIQQMNLFKTKVQARKAAWVNMGLLLQ